MARRYDSRTTIFSPEGRLYQVEYAMEAISNAGAAIGMLAKDGVVLVAEKKITSKVRSLVQRIHVLAFALLGMLQLLSGPGMDASSQRSATVSMRCLCSHGIRCLAACSCWTPRLWA